jgi:hypothetical protein
MSIATGQHHEAQQSITAARTATLRAQMHSPTSKPSRHHAEPGIPAQQMHSAQERASGFAGAERAKHHSRSTRDTPRDLAASRGKAAESLAMKGGAPCFWGFCQREARGPTEHGVIIGAPHLEPQVRRRCN